MLKADEASQDAPIALRCVQFVGYVAYFAMMSFLGWWLVRGYEQFGSPGLLLLVVVVGYLAADLASGIVHFLADNFGSPETPLLGRGFVLPFREHHDDPLGITRHGFFEANGNNALICLPVLIPVILFVPVSASATGYAAGAFTFVFLFAVFLTNQAHKWAHMETVPKPVEWLQQSGLVLGKTHHARHHTAPFDTCYCITVGAWNPLFERLSFFPRLERLIRRVVPRTNPMPRVQQEAAAIPMARQSSE